MQHWPLAAHVPGEAASQEEALAETGKACDAAAGKSAMNANVSVSIGTPHDLEPRRAVMETTGSHHCLVAPSTAGEAQASSGTRGGVESAVAPLCGIAVDDAQPECGISVAAATSSTLTVTRCFCRRLSKAAKMRFRMRL